MSTSSLLVVERLLLLLMPFLASVMAKRSPLLHSIGSSRMAAEGKGGGGGQESSGLGWVETQWVMIILSDTSGSWPACCPGVPQGCVFGPFLLITLSTIFSQNLMSILFHLSILFVIHFPCLSLPCTVQRFGVTDSFPLSTQLQPV